MKALIAYSTRYGATKGTAEEIARILQENKLNVELADLREKHFQDISNYDLIVLGSGMSMGGWGSEAKDFVEKFQVDFSAKKLALFISSLKPVEEIQGNTDLVARIRKVGLEDKILKYHLNPIATGIFGGVVDYPKISFLMRKGMEIGYKSKLQKYGFKQTQPDVYDLRDWNEIRDWAKALAKKTQK